MKKMFAALVTCALLLCLALLPSTSGAAAFAGSCGWQPVVDNAWHWSAAYGVYESYEGHYVLNGYNYRAFVVYSPLTGRYDEWYVYCG